MEPKALVTLAEFDRRATNRYLDGAERENGIACPECGRELRDTDPQSLLLYCPPRLNVDCPHCGYRGTRIATP